MLHLPEHVFIVLLKEHLMPEEVQYTIGDTSSKHQVNNVQLQYTVKRAYGTYLLVLGQFCSIEKASKLRFLFLSLLSIFSTHVVLYSAVGRSVFVYLSLREESLLLARHCSFPLSSRVKALRHSLGEASTI